MTDHDTATPPSPSRMDARTAAQLASEMSSLAGAMFGLLQPHGQPEPRSPLARHEDPPVPLAPPEPEPALAVPAIAVPSLDVPGLALPGATLADFDLDPEPEPEVEVIEAPPLADQPQPGDGDQGEADDQRSRALLDEIAFLDD